MLTVRERDGRMHPYLLERDDHGVLWVADLMTRWQLLGTLQQLGWQVIAAAPEDRKLLEECGVWGGRVQ